MPRRAAAVDPVKDAVRERRVALRRSVRRKTPPRPVASRRSAEGSAPAGGGGRAPEHLVGLARDPLGKPTELSSHLAGERAPGASSRGGARVRDVRARRTREKFGASAREVGSGARGGRSRTRGAECEEAPRGKVKKCRPAGRYFPQAGKENSSRVGRNAGSRLVARVRLIRGARTDGRGQVNPPGTRVMDKLDTEPSCVPEGADLSRVATPHHDARVFPSRVAGSMTRDARPPWRVHLSPSTNYERRILEEAFDRCDCPDARARTRTRSIGGHPEGSRRIGVGSSSPRRP